MNAASSALLWMSLQVFLFTLVGGAAFLMLRRRGPSAAGVCASVVLGLSLPIMLVLVSPWPRWNDGLSYSIPSASKNVAQIATLTDDSRPSPEKTGDATGAMATLSAWWKTAVQSLSPEATISAVASTGNKNWTQWIPWLLAAGIGLGLVRLAAGVWSVRQLRRVSTPIEDAKLAVELWSLAKQLSVGAVEIRETALLRSAATIGWRQPVVLLPADWQSWTETERRVVLAHELAHIARGDFLTGVVARLAAVVHFYQPLVLWLGRQLRVQQELAADGAAAAATGSQQVYLTTLAQMALRADEQSIPWGARAFLPGTSMLIKRVAWLKRGQGRKVEKSLNRSAWWLMIVFLATLALGVAGIRGPNSSPSNLAMAAPPEEKQPDQLPKELHRIGGTKTTNGTSLRTFQYVPADAKLVVGASLSKIVKWRAVAPFEAMINKEGGFEKKYGLKVSDVANIEFVRSRVSKQYGELPIDRIIMQSIEPHEWKKIIPNFFNPNPNTTLQAKELNGKEYIYTDDELCFYVANERTLIVGSENEIQKIIGGDEKEMGAEQFPEFLTEPVAVQAEMSLVKAITGLDKLPQSFESNPMAAMFLPLIDHVKVECGYTDAQPETDKAGFHVRLECDSADGAQQVAKTLEALRTVGLNVLQAKFQALKQSAPVNATAEQIGQINQFFDMLVKSLTEAKITAADKQVRVSADLDVNQSIVAGIVMPAMAASREAAMRTQSMNSMKQLALAMYLYNDINKHFPPEAIRSKDGKPLLSWRVALLPYLDQKALYEQFHLDEPWDSEHNIALIAKMPAEFRDPHEAAGSTNSSYFMPTGRGMFGGNKEGWQVKEITDGTALTIMVVEAKRDIPWTKPEDIEIDSDLSKPLPMLGGHLQSGDVFGAAFADGHVQIISNGADPKTLRACFTVDGREPVDMGKLNTPIPRKPLDSNDPYGPSATNPLKIEFRLGENEPSAGLSEATAADSPGVKVYLHPEATLTNADIESAMATADSLGNPVVSVTFTSQGAEKMAKLTEDNLGKPMVIMVDGKVLSAPRIQSKISSGKAQISGSFSQEEAERIAKGISSK